MSSFIIIMSWFKRFLFPLLGRIASNLNLSTKSYGKEEERFLVVSQKAQLCQIIDAIVKVGGENEKYKVFLPGSWSSGNVSRDQSSDEDSWDVNVLISRISLTHFYYVLAKLTRTFYSAQFTMTIYSNTIVSF